VPSVQGKFQAGEIHAMYGDVSRNAPDFKPYKVTYKSGTILIDDQIVINDLIDANGQPGLFNGIYALDNNAACK
jgi:hypothetical protein